MSDFAIDQSSVPAVNDQTVAGHARITTLSQVDAADLTKRPPSYDPDKGMLNHKPFLRYVGAALDGAGVEQIVEAGFGTVAEAELGEMWTRYVDQSMAPGALSDGSAVLIDPAEGMSSSRYLLVDLANRLSPSKAGRRQSRYNRSDSVELRNASELLAMQMLREDFKTHVRASGSQADALDDAAIDRFFEKALGDSRLLTPKRVDSNMPLDYRRLDIITPSAKVLIAEAMGLDDAEGYGRAERLAPPTLAAIAEALGLDGPEALPGSATPAPAPASLSEQLAKATPEQLAAALAALGEAGERSINKSYITLIERTILARSYNDFMQQTMERIADVRQQRRYERDIAAGDSATVYQQKKHVPESHLDAARTSVFTTAGDFAHVEIDESVELELMTQIEAEWKVLREALPHSDVKADLRFRKTGRHKAAGVYHPLKHNIAVDPRHPYSFVHEYFHHLDYTFGADADTKQLSLSEDFAEILHGVQRNMRASGKIDKLDYYTTPTEVFARGGELVCHWSGLATSLNGDATKYDTEVYQAFEPYRQQLMEWYGRRLDLDIAHDRPKPGTAPPALSAMTEAAPALSETDKAQQPQLGSINH
jgi:hypothetical protein